LITSRSLIITGLGAWLGAGLGAGIEYGGGFGRRLILDNAYRRMMKKKMTSSHSYPTRAVFATELLLAGSVFGALLFFSQSREAVHGCFFIIDNTK